MERKPTPNAHRKELSMYAASIINKITGAVEIVTAFHYATIVKMLSALDGDLDIVVTFGKTTIDPVMLAYDIETEAFIRNNDARLGLLREMNPPLPTDGIPF